MIYTFFANISRLPLPTDGDLRLFGNERREKILRHRTSLGKRQSFGAGLLLLHVFNRFGINNADITHNEYGKPMCNGIFFNISHSENGVACSVGEHSVGCDIELIRPAPMATAERFFLPSELDYINSLDKSRRDVAFFQLWTAKESYMKLRGSGMSLPPSSFEIAFKDKITAYQNGAAIPCSFKEYLHEDFIITACGTEDFSKDLIITDLSAY